MKNKLLLVSCIVLPFTDLANTINDIKELRAKIKGTSEEIRIVCTGFNFGTDKKLEEKLIEIVYG